MSFDGCIYLNNRSIVSFQNGHHDFSIGSLEVSLNELSYLEHFMPTASVKDELYPMLVPQTNQKYTPLCAGFMKFVKIVELKPSRIQKDCRSFDEEASMYNFAIVLSTNSQDWQTAASWRSIRVILEYNLALLHHWRAINLGVASELSVALHHYELAWKSIQQLNVVEGIQHLTLAVLNNMGHVHRQLMQFSQAKCCTGMMRCLMSAQVGSLARLETMEDYQTFVMNAMLPAPELPALAPAA